LPESGPSDRGHRLAAPNGWNCSSGCLPYLIRPEPKADLDGTFTKVVIPKAERVHCGGADYAPEGGVWMLSIAGVFGFSPGLGWKSIARPSSAVIAWSCQ
jgi:hypothetical protein